MELEDMFENIVRFTIYSIREGSFCQQIHFKFDGHVVNPGSERSMFGQVLMHPSERLMIRLPPRRISFPIQSNSNTSIYIGRAVIEVDIRQLCVRITIHARFTLPMSEKRKQHVPTWRAHGQCHLSLFDHAFLCNYGSSQCSLPSSKFVHGIRGHSVYITPIRTLILQIS
ncbi:hypothetical protein TNCV_983601 [Trichonephila clavipes]|nr:hypothetical protein TNCV_983601 [Trichonephila clavipes]